MKRLIIAMSGASGQIYGIRLLEVLREAPEIETHLVMSQAARMTISQETDYDPREVEALAGVSYRPGDIGAAIASGSFETMGMIVAPCSVEPLFDREQLRRRPHHRAADVQMKEDARCSLWCGRPLHLGHLEQMTQAARIGYIIFPPVPAFYGRPTTIDELVDGTVGRALARIGIDNDLYTRWLGMRGGQKQIVNS